MHRDDPKRILDTLQTLSAFKRGRRLSKERLSSYSHHCNIKLSNFLHRSMKLKMVCAHLEFKIPLKGAQRKECEKKGHIYN